MAYTVTSGTGYLKIADNDASEYVLLKNQFSFSVAGTKIYFSRMDAFSGAKYQVMYDTALWSTYNGVAPDMATIEADILSKATA